MRIWQTKERHKITKKREFHRVKIVIPSGDMKWVLDGLRVLKEQHGVPEDAAVRVVRAWNAWIVVNWFREI